MCLSSPSTPSPPSPLPRPRVLVASLPSLSADSLKSAADRLSSLLGDPSAVVLGSADEDGGKVALVAAFSPKVLRLV